MAECERYGLMNGHVVACVNLLRWKPEVQARRSSNVAVKRLLTRLHLELMRKRRGAEEEKVSPEELPEPHKYI